jgi:hypothetical protein
MEAMLEISLYSCTYFKLQECYVFLIIAYVFSSTKLENCAEQVLPRSERGEGGQGESGEQGEEMAQTMYAHMSE